MKTHAAGRATGACLLGTACLLLYASPIVAVPQAGKKPTGEWRVPRRAARKKNPIPSGQESIAIGKKAYEKECLSCHGKTGVGDGPGAKELKVSVGNLTSPKLADQTDGALYWKIKTGRTPMPSFATLLSKDARWHVVNYIRTFARGVRLVFPEYTVPDTHRSAISAVVSPYRRLRASLASEHPDGKGISALTNAASGLGAMESGGLEGKIREAWTVSGKGLVAAVSSLSAGAGLDALRRSFAAVSEELVRTLEMFGHAEASPLNVFHCSKSFKGKGAVWIQAGDKPVCPYSGQDSRKCGQLLKRLEALKPLRKKAPASKKGGGP
ncbi:MAG: c-type cytochrome [Planctomycetota bacterium]